MCLVYAQYGGSCLNLGNYSVQIMRKRSCFAEFMSWFRETLCEVCSIQQRHPAMKEICIPRLSSEA